MCGYVYIYIYTYIDRYIESMFIYIHIYTFIHIHIYAHVCLCEVRARKSLLFQRLDIETRPFISGETQAAIMSVPSLCTAQHLNRPPVNISQTLQ